MLSRLQITNYRCFRDHSLRLRQAAMLVGQNNAGKTTLVEALRFVALATQKARFQSFRPPPPWTDLPVESVGISPSLEDFDRNDRSTFYQYGEPPAVIRAAFSTGFRMEVYLGEGHGIHVLLFGPRNTPIRSRREAAASRFPLVAILPPVGPLREHESILNANYVKSNLNTSLASLHFRNQVFSLRQHFRQFTDLCEDTWPKLQVRGLEPVDTEQGMELHLTVRDEGFVGEVGRMGHGLQVWMQIVWFLCRNPRARTIILDEPDVFLHADIQRRLIRALSRRHRQVIVATHSVEMMAEVPPEDILVVDKRAATSRYADKVSAVQHVIESLGGVHNLTLTRLARARCVLVVEGDDTPVLQALQGVVVPESRNPIGDIPALPIGGWGGWQRAIGAAMVFRQTLGEDIPVYCILDRDSHLAETVNERIRDARKNNIRLHVWARKELENYLVVPDAIARLVMQKRGRREGSPSADEVRETITAELNAMRVRILRDHATAYGEAHRGHDAGLALEHATRIVDAAWIQPDGPLALAPGKDLLARLSSWSQGRAKVGFSSVALARAIHAGEVSQEVRHVLEAIEKLAPF